MTTWFKAGQYGNRIERVEIEKSTDSSVWIKGRRNAIKSSYENYFKSFDEAKSFLLRKFEIKLETYTRYADEAKINLAEIRKLKEV